MNTLTKLQENIINSNRDFPTVAYKKKTVILGPYIKEDISSGWISFQNLSCHHS